MASTSCSRTGRFDAGDVVRFHYLWKRQQTPAKKQVARRDRSVSSSVPGVVVLFAITSRTPQHERLFLPISQIECRRAGLDFPCWIILDEYNWVELDKAFDFESTVPLGSFSPAFLKKIARTV
ncbi:hypothetical protein [Rhizobium sp. 2TAF27]|uniref:hypothetical protein n=1 Tax=Rhizobium sp. 2TAF27 TaxID=3233013 RepID=UPI003F9B420D